MGGTTAVDEIADGIFRICTYLDVGDAPRPVGFNQFVILAEEPLVFHTGIRSLSGIVCDAIGRVVGARPLRWVSFGHVEADECGALPDLLRAFDRARAAFPSRAGDAVDDAWLQPGGRLEPDEVLDLGGRRLRFVPTPHAPHNREAHVVFEEVTGTLFCGDLLGQDGFGPATTEDLSVVERALASDADVLSAPPGPAVPATLRELARLEPHTLAVMHGSSIAGCGAKALRLFADGYRARPIAAALTATS
jgi:flavorubredoxin